MYRPLVLKYFFYSSLGKEIDGLFASDPGKAAWLRQQSQALDLGGLGLDDAGWPASCLAGSNQTGLCALPSN
jgi:hypothetical protein